MATLVARQPAAASGEAEQLTHAQSLAVLRELNLRTYKEQAIWVLNAGWKGLFERDTAACEGVWSAMGECIKLDPRGAAGNELDKLTSHRLLERVDRALSAYELKEALCLIDADHSKCLSLLEFLVFRHQLEWREVVHAPQGAVDAAQLEQAERMVHEAQSDIAASELRAAEARQALKESVESELVAKAQAEAAAAAARAASESSGRAAATEAAALGAERDAVHEESEAFQSETLAKAAEAKATAAKEEQEAIRGQVAEAVAVVQREQDAFTRRCAELRAESDNPALGLVKRNTAKNELAQLQASDPQPLQRAIISQTACMRKQERLTAAAAGVELAAKRARHISEESRAQAVQSREKAADERACATSAKRAADKAQAAAEAAHADSVRSKDAAEDARRASELLKAGAEEALHKSFASFNSATKCLEKTKKECRGAGAGKIWFMERELHEAKRFMSKAQVHKLEAAAMQAA